MNGRPLTAQRILHRNDRLRGIAAAYHLHRSLTMTCCYRNAGSPFALRAAREHLRIATGYLGAVGFENHWRL